MQYFHELTNDEISEIVENKKTWGYVIENYLQPEWCDYPNALNEIIGCWSLTDLGPSGIRGNICVDFCKDCDCFKKLNSEQGSTSE